MCTNEPIPVRAGCCMVCVCYSSRQRRVPWSPEGPAGRSYTPTHGPTSVCAYPHTCHHPSRQGVCRGFLRCACMAYPPPPPGVLSPKTPQTLPSPFGRLAPRRPPAPASPTVSVPLVRHAHSLACSVTPTALRTAPRTAQHACRRDDVLFRARP